MPHHIIVVAGPTASGKSDFAVELALRENGEIISADSRQVYKGLDIGTGKITQEEMKGVPHHMLDVYDLDDDVSVARYVHDALPIINDILQREKTPIICGGTGQYLDALMFDTTFPEVEPNKKLRKDLEQKSTEELFAMLEERDIERATIIDRHNRVRLIRALEIIESLGKVPTTSENKLRYDTTLYLLSPTRDILKEKIEKRLEKRLKIGMVDEVRSVVERGYTSSDMKKFGIEYEAIGAYLEGKMNEEDMKQTIISSSMKYAKRQETWNKKYLPFATIVKVQ